MNYTDEQLSALLDGELSIDEEHKIRDLVVQDPDFARRLDELMFADTAIRLEYQKIDARPLPDKLLEMLYTPDIKDGLAIAGKGSFLSSLWQTMQMPAGLFASAAATLLLAVGVVFLSQIDTGETVNQLAVGQLPSDSAIHHLLEEAPSATHHTLAADEQRQFSALLSFNNKAGQYCREFTVSDTAGVHRSVACRDNGYWSIQLLVLQDTGTTSQGYQTASGNNPAIFEQYMHTQMNGLPLSAEQERTAIENRWKVQPTDKQNQ